MNLFILGEHHIMRDSHWRRSVAPTTTRISGFHMVLLSKMHGCSCCSNLNPLTTIETFFFVCVNRLNCLGYLGVYPLHSPEKLCCPCIRSAVPAATAHKNAPEKLLATAPMEVQRKLHGWLLWVTHMIYSDLLYMSIMMIA